MPEYGRFPLSVSPIAAVSAAGRWRVRGAAIGMKPSMYWRRDRACSSRDRARGPRKLRDCAHRLPAHTIRRPAEREHVIVEFPREISPFATQGRGTGLEERA